MPNEPSNAAEPLASAVGSGPTWRVSADVRNLDGRPLHALRLLLVADVLRRHVEDLRGGQVFLAVLAHETGTAAARVASADALWIRGPSTHVRSPAGSTAFLGGPSNVVLEPASEVTATSVLTSQRTLRIGAVTTPAPIGPATLASAPLRDHEPLTLRLALLRFPYSSPAVLSRARLNRAEETLRRWRFKVAGWADMPSAPASPQHQLL